MKDYCIKHQLKHGLKYASCYGMLTPPKELMKQKHDYEVAEGGFRMCLVCGDRGVTDWCLSPKEPMEWGIEFDKLWYRVVPQFTGDSGSRRDFLSFIAKTIAKEREEEQTRIINKIGMLALQSSHEITWGEIDLIIENQNAIIDYLVEQERE